MPAGKASDAGWIYHVSNRYSNAEPVGAPPPSQIPLLSNIEPGPQTPQNIRGMIKETDSAYVRLAKQGGRSDLLAFKEPKPHAEKPKGHSRVNWFYLEDNAREDAANADPQHPKEPYQFALPDYMVHHDNSRSHGQTDDKEEYAPKRAPFHFDNQSAFQREGASITDKTVAIEEPSSVGRGVRNAKQKKQNVKHGTNQRNAKAENSEQIDSRYHTVPRFDSEEGKPMMSKIMSYGYVKEWEEKRNQWQNDQAKIRSEEAAATEEKELDIRADKPLKKSQPSKAAGDGSVSKLESNQTKEPFKLSKFKNVPAKTNTFWD